MANISTSQRISKYVTDPRRTLCVSRNIIDVAPKLTKEQLNLIIAVIIALSMYIIKNTLEEERCEFVEQRIEIPRRYVSAHHASDITGLLVDLMDYSVVFRYAIPGYQSAGITRFISGIKCENGHVIVTIPSDTILWLLYCGKSVGFGLIETHVFFELKMMPQKLLYLYLLSKTDQSSVISTVEIPTHELNPLLGVKESRPISSLCQKYLQPFSKKLTEIGSKYKVSYEMIKQVYTGKPGPRPISSVRFVIQNTALESKGGDMLYTMVEKLISLLNKYKRISVRRVDLIKAIDETGKKDEIIDYMRWIAKINEKEENYLKLCNTAIKRLREEYGIDVYSLCLPPGEGKIQRNDDTLSRTLFNMAPQRVDITLKHL